MVMVMVIVLVIVVLVIVTPMRGNAYIAHKVQS